MTATGEVSRMALFLKQPPPSKPHPVRNALLLAAAAWTIGLTWPKRSPRTVVNTNLRGGPDG